MVALGAGLAFAITPAHAEQRGKVYLVVNPQAPRGEWQRRPLPGAYVTTSWTMIIPGPGHGGDKCLYSELARTDENGEYVMEGPNPLTAAVSDASSHAYSRGRESVDFPYPGSRTSANDITLAPSTRKAEARLSQLTFFTEPGCYGATLGGGNLGDRNLSDPRSLLVPLLRAVQAEAKALNVESELGRRYVESIDAAVSRAMAPPRPAKLRVAPAPAQGSPVEARPVRPEDIH